MREAARDESGGAAGIDLHLEPLAGGLSRLLGRRLRVRRRCRRCKRGRGRQLGDILAPHSRRSLSRRCRAVVSGAGGGREEESLHSDLADDRPGRLALSSERHPA